MEQPVIPLRSNQVILVELLLTHALRCKTGIPTVSEPETCHCHSLEKFTREIHQRLKGATEEREQIFD